MVKRPAKIPLNQPIKQRYASLRKREQPSDSESPIDDARREKIEKLKKAVADGTYNVSAEEVARKLIEHMLEPKE